MGCKRVSWGKSKQEVEKQKRKIEGDFKLTQETLADLDRIKAELSQGLQRKQQNVDATSCEKTTVQYRWMD